MRLLRSLALALPAFVVVAACTSSTFVSSSGTGAAPGTSSSGSGAGTTSSTGSAGGDGGTDAPADAPFDVTPVPPPDGSIADPCSLPGSLQFTANGTVTVPGGDPSWPSLAWLHLPPGFCAHYFGTVGDARKMRFAPGGELFVASPTAGTTGGASSAGLGAIVVLPDDNLDGVADTTITFLSFGAFPASTMPTGMLFANGSFYYQDGTPPGTSILRMPYVTGDRKPSGPSQQVADITVYTSPLHWPKSIDMADDGTIYVANGGDQSESCVASRPFHGGILKVDPTGANMGGIQVAKGFRNPISVRCVKGHDRCFALELALDYSSTSGGREKLVPIREGDDWGFPCCATANTPYAGMPPGTDCSGVAAETNSFVIGDTPFDLDVEPGKWPGVWQGRAFVVTHGAFGTWVGARMVAIPVDSSTGLPTPSTNTGGMEVGMVDFATGWDDQTLSHGRPSSVEFHPDGRLFVGNDNTGVIFWIAPIGM